MSLLLDHYRNFESEPGDPNDPGAGGTDSPDSAEGVGADAFGTRRRSTLPVGDSLRLPATGELATPVVDIVIPVHNEVHSVAASVTRLHDYLQASLPNSFRITIADNASTDGTWTVVRYLHRTLDHVAGVQLPQKGRGRALRMAWTASDAQVLAYMDADLSTDLDAVLPLLAPLISGHSDLAIGSRLARGARIVRGRKRDVISRCYNRILRIALHARFTDAQCGFKAITADAARLLLPLVEDNGWFFDTELLVLAERSGLRIYEVPVDWIDDPDSRVDIVDTAVKDLKGMWRVSRTLSSGRLPLADVKARLTAAVPALTAPLPVRTAPETVHTAPPPVRTAPETVLTAPLPERRMSR